MSFQQRPRVLHVSSDVAIGGAGRYLETLLGVEAVWRDFDVAVACPAGPLQVVLAEQGIETVTYGPGNRSFSLPIMRALHRIMRAWRPDLVHTHGSLAGRIAGRLAGARIVYTKHGMAHQAERSVQIRGSGRLLNGLVDRLFADAVIAVSPGVGEDLVRKGTPRRLVHVIANAVALPPPPPTGPHPARVELGLGDRPVALVTGRLAVEKGHTYLLQAWVTVRDAVPAAVLLIAGDGPDRQALEDEATALGLGDSVRFLGFRPDARTLPQAADLFVIPSLSEGLSLALLEAMACGCPVVGSDIPGIAVAAKDGEHGLLVPPGDVRKLAAACIALLQDRPRAQRLGAAARRHVEAAFGPEPQARAVADLYRKVLGQRG